MLSHGSAGIQCEKSEIFIYIFLSLLNYAQQPSQPSGGRQSTSSSTESNSTKLSVDLDHELPPYTPIYTQPLLDLTPPPADSQVPAYRGTETRRQAIESSGTTPSLSTQSSIEQQKRSTISPPSASGPSRHAQIDYVTNPFIHQNGRRFLRDPSLPYPLPVDMAELHRQTLRTLMLTQVYSLPFCNPFLKGSTPKRILEMGCGSGLWSSVCHDYLKSRFDVNVSFTGLDIAPLAPDLSQQGVDWRFVQHNMSDPRGLPFADAEFDFIFIKDVAFCTASPQLTDNPLSEPLRVLKPGGTFEVWESDHIFRSLLPYPSVPVGTSEDVVKQAERSATYLMSTSTAFVTAQNKYLQDCNTWIEMALEKRGLSATPCALATWAVTSDFDKVMEIGSRRVAIPFGEIRWEQGGARTGGPPDRFSTMPLTDQKTQSKGKFLTATQAAIRRTALVTTIQFIESLELMLKEESGKRQDEWDRWWASMTNNLLEQNGTINGECLEVGAWWGRKKFMQ